MAVEKLQAKEASVHEFLYAANVLFALPVFQRPYSWRPGKDLGTFFRDLIDLVPEPGDQAAEEQQHFIGTVVLHAKKGEATSPVITRQVVDGQQRLVTIALTLAALGAVHGELADDRRLAQDVYGEYLSVAPYKREREPRFSVTFRDRTQFARVLKHLEPDARGLLKGGGQSGALYTAYEYLVASIRRAVVERGGDVAVIDRIREALLERMVLVWVLLGSDENPFEVFKSLNGKGQRLDLIDLIKSDIMSRVPAQQLEEFERNEWQQFERPFSESDDDEGKKALGDFIFPYALVQSSRQTKSRVFTYLSDERWTEALASPKAILEDMNDCLPAFLALHPSVPLGRYSGPLASPLQYIRALYAPSVSFPLPMRLEMAVRHGELDAADAIACLKWMEAFLMRRAIGGHEPTGLHAVFKQAWEKSKGSVTELDAFVRGRKTVEMPTDEEFKSTLESKAVDSHKNAVRALLFGFENDLLGPKAASAGATDWGFFWMKKAPEIDHLMPKARAGEWEKVVSEQDHAKHLGLIGNLALLETANNLDKSNRSWAEAQGVLKKSKMLHAREVLQDEAWGTHPVEAIKRRSSEMATWAVGRYRYLP